MQFDEFLDILDLLKTPAKYEAQIAALQERNDAIQESIKQMNVVGDINKAKDAALKLKDKAEKLVETATKEAADILTGAQTAFNKRHEELKAREVVAEQAITDYNTIKSQHILRDNELRAQEKALKVAREVLEKQQAELAVKQAEVDLRLDKLRQAMG